MSRFTDVDEADVHALGERLGISFAGEQKASARDRINGFAELYHDLEARRPSPPADGGGDRYERRPHWPTPDDNPHNGWITNFDLVRPEADGRLSGLEVGVKDNLAVRGAPMTCGSLAYEDHVPGEHATVVERLLDAGARIRGKTNMDELAFAITGETSAFGPTTNPVDTDHVAGGSSSGSGALVAAGEVDLALGSDTGGSVRVPASYCGIVGIKPTHGSVPHYGFANLASSLDHVGPLARDVETAALGLEVIAGSDPLAEPPAFRADIGTDLSEVTVGIPEQFFHRHVSADVERTVRGAAEAFEDDGGSVESIDIQALSCSRPAFWGIIPTEFAALYLTRGIAPWSDGPIDPTLAAAHDKALSRSKHALGTNVKEMLSLGAYILTDQDGYQYIRGRALQRELRDAFDAALADVDVLAAPSSPRTALELGGFVRGETAPPNWATHPTNLTGHPSVSVPCGAVDGLPVGLQLIGARGDDGTVIDVAYEYEKRR
jgi:amidase/aspartyl-tRNA(Asn)/glutamyl-tRNA(Gln) amidotransferase subunit A